MAEMEQNTQAPQTLHPRPSGYLLYWRQFWPIWLIRRHDHALLQRAQQPEVSIFVGRTPTAAMVAFKDLRTTLKRIEHYNALPIEEDRATQLCYLSCVRPFNRMPITEEQHSVFERYVYARFATFRWLDAKLAVPSFFYPIIFPIIMMPLALYWSGYTNEINIILSGIFSILATLGGQLAGWVITGTQPNRSSEAANLCQNMLLDMSDDYMSYAYYLLDLYGNDNPKLSHFAHEFAATMEVENFVDAMVSLVPRPDPLEVEDPILSRARCTGPLTTPAMDGAWCASQEPRPPGRASAWRL